MTPSDRLLDIHALRRLEERAQHEGVDLMARAAAAIADWVGRHLAPPARLLIAAGPGNNGGDALMAALLLRRRGYTLEIVLPREPTTTATRAARDALRADGAELASAVSGERCALIVDGLFGIGLTRALHAPWSTLVDTLNASGTPILALDVPSGLDAWTGTTAGHAIAARYTLTFLGHKPGLFGAAGADLAGEVELATLAYAADDGEPGCGAINRPVAHALQRCRDSHKGRHGSVGIVGGAAGMLGAALLAGRAALTAGAGKVWVAALDPALAVDVNTPELMLLPRVQLPDADILAVGPGLGASTAAAVLLSQALADTRPLILDADALNLIAGDSTLADALVARAAPTLLTPHPAEAARLLGQDTHTLQADRVAAVRALAAHFACTVVLKGAGSLIAAPDGHYRLNPTGGPALAAAGQGDVLCGLCAALMAQGMDAFAAACLAVFVHGQAGDAFQREHMGYIGLTASETGRRAGLLLNRLTGQRPYDKLVTDAADPA